MSKSKLMGIVIGLTMIIVPVQMYPSSQTVDEYMEADINTRTNKESVEVDSEIEFISTISEMITEETEEEVDEDDDLWVEVNLHISYYTDLQIENTIGKETTDAKGNKLSFGAIAIPRNLELGTKFQIDGYDNFFYGNDRGSKKYIKWINDNTMKIDMYIPRNKNENNDAYFKRVNNMGVTKTKGRYLVEEK